MPTPGGQIDIAFLSQGIAHVQHGDVLTLQIVERLKGNNSLSSVGLQGIRSEPGGTGADSQRTLTSSAMYAGPSLLPPGTYTARALMAADVTIAGHRYDRPFVYSDPVLMVFGN